MQNVTTLKVTYIVSYRTRHAILLPYESAIVRNGIYPKVLKTYPHKNLHMDSYSNFIYNYLNLEAAQDFHQ